MTEDQKKKISNSMKGRKPKNLDSIKHYWKGKKLSEDHKRKIGLKSIGRKKSEEGRKRIAEASRGEKSHLWKGGVTPLIRQIRNCLNYRQWRDFVFQRDNYTCQICGQRGGELNADHIEAFSDIFYRNDIKTFEEALLCYELWNINNGRTLCKCCHLKTDNYGTRAKKKKHTAK